MYIIFTLTQILIIFIYCFKIVNDCFYLCLYYLQVKKKSKKYRPHVGSLPNFKKISLESVTDLRPKPGTRVSQKSTLSDFQLSSELLVRNQYGRTSGPKEVIYDEKGNVVKVQKLNVANFPKHRYAFEEDYGVCFICCDSGSQYLFSL